MSSSIAWPMAAAVGISTLIVTLPVLYFWQQNDQLLNDLAHHSAPALIRHLERERWWVFAWTAFSISAATMISYFCGDVISRRRGATSVDARPSPSVDSLRAS